MASNPCSSPSTPQSAPRKPRHQVYDLGWAYSRVELALKSHARAWEIVLKILGIQKRHLAVLLASADPDWPRIREFSHWVDRMLTRYADWVTPETKLLYKSDVKEALKKGLGYVKFSESLKKYLTDRNLDLIIEEQGFEGMVEVQAEAIPRLFPEGVQLELDLRYSGRCTPGACGHCETAPKCRRIRD